MSGFAKYKTLVFGAVAVVLSFFAGAEVSVTDEPAECEQSETAPVQADDDATTDASE